MIRHALRLMLPCMSAVVLSGCYTYVPVELPAPLTPVRVTVPVTNVVQDRNRAPQTYTIEGVVVSSGDSLVLATERRTETGAAFREIVRFDTVRVATRSLMAIDEKVYSQPRTIALGVLIAAGTAGLAKALLDVTTGTGGDGGGNGGSTTNSLRIDPIFAAILKLVGH